MKHLAYILFLILAVSCSSDDDEKNEYIDNNLIAGSWYIIRGSDSIVRTFNGGIGEYLLYDKIDVILKSKSSDGKYKLTKDAIIYQGAKKGLPYKLNGDILSIYENNSEWADWTKAK